MNREELKALGLNDDQIEEVMKTYGKSVNDLKAKAEKVDVLDSKVKDFEIQLSARDQQLEKLKEIDVDSMKSEIDRLKEENQTIADQSEQRLNAELLKRDKDNAIDLMLRDSGAKYPDLVKKTMNLEDVVFEDGQLVGFDDVLNSTKETYSDLFEAQEEEKGKDNFGYVPGVNQKTNPRKTLDPAEAGRLKAQERHNLQENKGDDQ